MIYMTYKYFTAKPLKTKDRKDNFCEICASLEMEIATATIV